MEMKKKKKRTNIYFIQQLPNSHENKSRVFRRCEQSYLTRNCSPSTTFRFQFFSLVGYIG